MPWPTHRGHGHHVVRNLQLRAYILAILKDGRIAYRNRANTAWTPIGTFTIGASNTDYHRIGVDATTSGAVVVVDGTTVGTALPFVDVARFGGLRMLTDTYVNDRRGATFQQVLVDDVVVRMGGGPGATTPVGPSGGRASLRPAGRTCRPDGR